MKRTTLLAMALTLTTALPAQAGYEDACPSAAAAADLKSELAYDQGRLIHGDHEKADHEGKMARLNHLQIFCAGEKANNDRAAKYEHESACRLYRTFRDNPDLFGPEPYRAECETDADGIAAPRPRRQTLLDQCLAKTEPAGHFNCYSHPLPQGYVRTPTTTTTTASPAGIDPAAEDMLDFIKLLGLSIL